MPFLNNKSYILADDWDKTYYPLIKTNTILTRSDLYPETKPRVIFGVVEDIDDSLYTIRDIDGIVIEVRPYTGRKIEVQLNINENAIVFLSLILSLILTNFIIGGVWTWFNYIS
ncbi:MAG: hypothetical protein ACFFG0_04050 [Candidatus Thorarchaeota archaeon]